MRVIEQQMLDAIDNRIDWSKDNTSVTHTERYADIRLHNNLIAVYDNVDNEFHVNIDVLKAYPTNTTKSRLRALGVNVSTKRGVTYLNGEAIQS